MSFHWKKLLIIGSLAIVFIVPPLVMEIGTAVMNLLIMLFIFIILSQSWNLMGGYTGQINLGLAAFLVVDYW
jgi:branched-chain amino acid transport system permease protein